MAGGFSGPLKTSVTMKTPFFFFPDTKAKELKVGLYLRAIELLLHPVEPFYGKVKYGLQKLFLLTQIRKNFSPGVKPIIKNPRYSSFMERKKVKLL